MIQTVRFSANQIGRSIGSIAKTRNNMAYIPNSQNKNFDVLHEVIIAGEDYTKFVPDLLV